MHLHTRHNYWSLSSFRLQLGESLGISYKLAPRQPLRPQSCPCSAPRREKPATAWARMKSTAAWHSQDEVLRAGAALQAMKIFRSPGNEVEEPGLKEPSQAANCCLSPTPCSQAPRKIRLPFDRGTDMHSARLHGEHSLLPSSSRPTRCTPGVRSAPVYPKEVKLPCL